MYTEFPDISVGNIDARLLHVQTCVHVQSMFSYLIVFSRMLSRFVRVHIEIMIPAKRPLGRPRRRWVDNIEIDPGEIGCGGGGVMTGLVWVRIGTSGEIL
jgi:hypothetical protein